MNIYVVTTNYFNNGFFGTYTTIKRARMALEDYLATVDDITSFEDVGNYCYQFTSKDGTNYNAEINWDLIDAEFEEGIIQDDKQRLNRYFNFV